MSTAATTAGFPMDFYDRADHEIRRYGHSGFDSMVMDVYKARREPWANDALVAVDTLAWLYRMPYAKRKKVIDYWAGQAQEDDGVRPPWRPMRDVPPDPAFRD